MPFNEKNDWVDYDPNYPNNPKAIPTAADQIRIEKGIADAHKGDINDNSISSIKLKTISMEDRIKLVNLHEDVIQAMAGTTSVNSIPEDGAVTIEKFAPELQGIFIQEGSEW